MADNPFATSSNKQRYNTTSMNIYNNNSGKDPYIVSHISNPTPTTTTKKTGGGSSSGSTATVNTGTDVNGYLQSLYAQRQQAAQDAYDRSMSALQNSYNTQRQALTDNLNSARGTMDRSYNNSLGKINKDAENSLQEAYVNKMLTQKNLSQQLAAQGITGGASESTMAGLANNYGNARNNITDTWNTNKSDLENTYQNSLANLLQSYNSDLATLEANRAQQEVSLMNNLQNQIASGTSDYTQMLLSNPTILQAMATAKSNMEGYTPTATEAINPVQTVSTQQSNDMGSATQYARQQYLDLAQRLADSGLSANSIIYQLQVQNPSLTSNAIRDILSRVQ